MTTSWTCSSVGKAWWSQSAAPLLASVQSLRWLSSPSSSSWRLTRWRLWWWRWTSTCWSWLSIGTADPSARPTRNCSAATTGICNVTSSELPCKITFKTYVILWFNSYADKPNSNLDQVLFALNVRLKLSRISSVCSLNLLIWIDII